MLEAPAATRRPRAISRGGAGDIAYLRLVGARIQALRKQVRMSRLKLAEASGVSVCYLKDLEDGKGNASLLLLRDVARALGAQVETLTSEADHG